MNPQQLPIRDIHLPDPVGWWPPAPGWWALAILVPATIAGLYWLIRRIRRANVRRLALRELRALRDNQEFSAHERIRRLSVLLRRICLSAYGRSEVAALTGQHWLNFLADRFQEPRFRTDVGRLLIDAPYRPESEGEFDELFELCAHVFRRLPKTGLTS